MAIGLVDSLGWVATVICVGSYFCASPEKLRRVQMLSAAIWIAYGVLTGAAPVFVANVLVLCAATWTAWRPSPAAQIPRDERPA